MENSKDNPNLEQKYFDKELTPEEETTFKEHLKSDKELLTNVVNKELMIKSLFEADRQEAKNDLRRMLEEHKSNNEKEKTTGHFSIMKIAASVVLLIAIGAMFFFLQNSSQPQDLVAQYYEPYAVETAYRGNEGNKADIQKYMEAYKQNNFAEAVVGFKNVADLSDKNSSYNLLTASCYLMLSQASEAVPYLLSVKDSEDFIIKAYSEWYLSLCYIKMDQKSKAKMLLKEIENSNNLFSKKAAELSKKLN
jgi:hypothetical protein